MGTTKRTRNLRQIIGYFRVVQTRAVNAGSTVRISFPRDATRSANKAHDACQLQAVFVVVTKRKNQAKNFPDWNLLKSWIEQICFRANSIHPALHEKRYARHLFGIQTLRLTLKRLTVMVQAYRIREFLGGRVRLGG
jgi:hypothetical protein